MKTQSISPVTTMVVTFTMPNTKGQESQLYHTKDQLGQDKDVFLLQQEDLVSLSLVNDVFFLKEQQMKTV